MANPYPDNIIAVIPARMGSSRFPGKPMAKIVGMPMIGHVYFRTKMSRTLKEVYIATCDKEIAEYAASIGAKYIMTSDTHERASDRTAEAMLKIEQQTGEPVDVVVMVQGDEPMVVPEMIDLAIAPMLQDPSIEYVNLMAPIRSQEEHEDPNCPKVVVDQQNFALYFSREPIPSRKKWNGKDAFRAFKQVCIMPFSRQGLLSFNALPPTPLEKIESIDMNRVLEHGRKVKMVYEEFETYSVDTPQDLQKVERYLTQGFLAARYARN